MIPVIPREGVESLLGQLVDGLAERLQVIPREGVESLGLDSLLNRLLFDVIPREGVESLLRAGSAITATGT